MCQIKLTTCLSVFQSKSSIVSYRIVSQKLYCTGVKNMQLLIFLPPGEYKAAIPPIARLVWSLFLLHVTACADVVVSMPGRVGSDVILRPATHLVGGHRTSLFMGGHR